MLSLPRPSQLLQETASRPIRLALTDEEIEAIRRLDDNGNLKLSSPILWNNIRGTPGQPIDGPAGIVVRPAEISHLQERVTCYHEIRHQVLLYALEPGSTLNLAVIRTMADGDVTICGVHIFVITLETIGTWLIDEVKHILLGQSVRLFIHRQLIMAKVEFQVVIILYCFRIYI